MVEDDLWAEPADELSGEEIFIEPAVQKTQVPVKSANAPGSYRAALKKVVLKKIAEPEASRSLTDQVKHNTLLPSLAATNTDSNNSQNLAPPCDPVPHSERLAQFKTLGAAPTIYDDLWGDDYQQPIVAETSTTLEEPTAFEQEVPIPSNELDHRTPMEGAAESDLETELEDDLWAISNDLQMSDEDEELLGEWGDNGQLFTQEDEQASSGDSLLLDSESTTILFQDFGNESSLRDFQNAVETGSLLGGFEFIDIEAELAELEQAEEELATVIQQSEVEREIGVASKRGTRQAPGWMGSSSVLYINWEDEENAEQEALRRLGYVNLKISEASRAFVIQAARACRLTHRQERQLTTRLANARHQLAQLPDHDDYEVQRNEIKAEIAELERTLTYNLQWVAVKKAPRFLDYGIELDDLIQYGLLGVIAGIQHFDIDKNARLLVVVNWWVFQALNRAVAEYAPLIRLPVYIYETLDNIKKHRSKLEMALGRSPTYEELANAVQMTVERVKELLSLPRTVSLDSYVKTEHANDGCSFQPVEEALVVAEDTANTRMELSIKQEVDAMLACLTPRERQVIELRYDLTHEYGEMRTLDEVGKIMGITRERVRQIEDRAFRKIRAEQHSRKKDVQNQGPSQKVEEDDLKSACKHEPKQRKTSQSSNSLPKVNNTKGQSRIIEVEEHTFEMIRLR